MRVADVTQYLIRWTVSSPSFRVEKFLLPRFLTNFGSPSRLPVVNQGTRSTATLRSFLVFVPRFGSRSLLLFSSIRRSWKILRRWGARSRTVDARNEYFTLQLESFNFPRPLDLYRSMVKKVTFWTSVYLNIRINLRLKMILLLFLSREISLRKNEKTKGKTSRLHCDDSSTESSPPPP